MESGHNDIELCCIILDANILIKKTKKKTRSTIHLMFPANLITYIIIRHIKIHIITTLQRFIKHNLN